MFRSVRFQSNIQFISFALQFIETSTQGLPTYQILSARRPYSISNSITQNALFLPSIPQNPLLSQDNLPVACDHNILAETRQPANHSRFILKRSASNPPPNPIFVFPSLYSLIVYQTSSIHISISIIFRLCAVYVRETAPLPHLLPGEGKETGNQALELCRYTDVESAPGVSMGMYCYNHESRTKDDCAVDQSPRVRPFQDKDHCCS